MAKAPNTFPDLITPRLRLRRFRTGDLDGLHACFGDADTMRYWIFPACKTKAETARWLRTLARAVPVKYQAWAVAEKQSDRCIGMVNYHHREAQNRRLEIGYMLARSHRGRGLMTEALTALIRHCIDKLRTHRVEAMIDPRNAASIRLVERLGFCCEGGPLRDYWQVDGRGVSVLIYGLIATAGRARKARGRSRKSARKR